MAISDITTPTATKKGPPCGVCLTLDGLDEDEATALRRLLADKSWRYTELAERLRDEGLTLESYQLGRHARGDCDAHERLRTKSRR